jgi:hypothetical protein
MPLPDTACVICGKELTVRQGLMGRLCGDVQCQDAWLRRQLETHRDEAAAAVGVAAPETFRLIVIPATDRRVAPLPEHRVRLFRKHLAQVVREAFRRRRDEAAADVRATAAGGASVWPALPAAHAAVLGRVCAACEGYCCTHGGTHAFLDDDRILRHLREHPDARPRDVMRDYLSRIPDQTYNDACVYQAAAGCTLPPTMRADICNDYHCSGLKQLRQHLTERAGDDDPAQRRCCAVARRDNVIQRSVFIDDDGLRRYDPWR